jgi:LysM repeat protein
VTHVETVPCRHGSPARSVSTRPQRSRRARSLLAAASLVAAVGLSAGGSSGKLTASPTVVSTETPIPAITIVTPTPGVPGNSGGDGNNPAAGATPTVDLSTNGQNGSYTVQPGDTLYQIAVKSNVTLQALMQANSITDPGTLQAGQVLVIPPH